ncbi:MAG TPA: hypothetical protein VF395_13595 [Polyangiaceae bacterium]
MDAGAGGSAGETVDSGAGGSLLDASVGGNASRDATPDVAAPVPDAQAGDAGPCVPFTNRCHDHNRETCYASGGWSVSDVCSLDTQICRSGACVINTPYPVGNSVTDGTFSTFVVPDNWIYFVPITVTTAATVSSLQLLAAAAGGSTRMYLYTDNGGKPGNFVARTATITVASGLNSGVPVPSSASMTAGQTYWVGAEFFGGVSVFQESITGAVAHRFSHSFASALPADPFPTTTQLSDVSYNFYLGVRDVP